MQRAFGITPRRPAGKPPLIISICNFKGGVAKTTTTAHLAQYLCLHGYRVLAVDLDAQASLTQMFGILPHTEVPSNQTARPFFEGPGYPMAAESGLDRHARHRHSEDALGPAGFDASILGFMARNSRSPPESATRITFFFIGSLPTPWTP